MLVYVVALYAHGVLAASILESTPNLHSAKFYLAECRQIYAAINCCVICDQDKMVLDVAYVPSRSEAHD